MKTAAKKFSEKGKAVYLIPVEQPKNLQPLPDQAGLFAHLRESLKKEIEQGLLQGAEQEKARAVYQAICLDWAQALREKYPADWSKALQALTQYPKVLGALFFEADTPAGDKLRQRALATGVMKPEKRVKIW